MTTKARRAASVLRAVTRRTGFDVVRYPHRLRPEHRWVRLLLLHGVDLVLDVGANEGLYGSQLRQYGYRGRIVSFEPLSGPYRRLQRRVSRDPLWSCKQMALGPYAGEERMHVAGNS